MVGFCHPLKFPAAFRAELTGQLTIWLPDVLNKPNQSFGCIRVPELIQDFREFLKVCKRERIRLRCLWLRAPRLHQRIWVVLYVSNSRTRIGCQIIETCLLKSASKQRRGKMSVSKHPSRPFESFLTNAFIIPMITGSIVAPYLS
jgi:hypothetical protein